MFRVLATAAAVLGFVVAVAAYQEPPGFGGFGGPVMSPNSAAMLLNIPEVRGELRIEGKQAESIDNELADIREKSRDVFAGFRFEDFRDMSQEEREKRGAELRKKIVDSGRASDERLAKLLNKEQNQRLAELKLQREGIAALNRDDVVAKLKLTDAQKEKIQKAADGLRSGFPTPEDRADAMLEAVAALDAKQKETWTGMTGKTFEFPAGPGFGGPGFGPGGFGGFGGFGGPGGFGPGGPGGPGGGERKIVEKFDKDGDGRLNTEERKEARASLASSSGGGRRGGPGGRGPGGPGGGPGRGNQDPPKAGPRVSPKDVKPVSEEISLYDPTVLRTLFLEFEGADWEREMAEFKGTDVEMPATLTVDGKTYPDVGVHFRGASSFGMIGEGSKRSLNVSLDYVDEEQRLLGYKTLNLLNSNGDPSFLHSVLCSHISRQYIPAPKANLVKVVINGESWGIYANVQQFDKMFLKENYESSKGVRWKVPGRPGGRGGLDYVGENIEDYKRNYEMKTDDGDKAWKDLIALCRTLKETPTDKLEEALEPILDIDNVLWFLALDDALVNEDGYWTRASDYSLYRDGKGTFHLIPHDMNETFHAGGPPGGFGPGGMGGFGPGGFGGGGFGQGGRGPRGAPPGGAPPNGAEGRQEERRPEDDRRPEGRLGEGRPPEGRPNEGRPGENRPGGGRPGEGRFGGGREGMGRGGPGGPGGMRGGGADLDPLVATNDTGKPLRSRLLAMPALRTRYLQHVHTIAKDGLDWSKLGPLVRQYETLVSKEVEADTRKLSSFAAFQNAVSQKSGGEATQGRGGQSLRSFIEQRRKFLLEHPEVVKASKAIAAK